MTLDILISILTAFIPLLTALVVVLGWYVVHDLSASRDRTNKRNDLTVQYLIEAYRRIEAASNRQLTNETAEDFENAIADIQLFGTPHQVALLRKLLAGFNGGSLPSVTPMLDDLRKSLRVELALEPIPDGISILRMGQYRKPRVNM